MKRQEVKGHLDLLVLAVLSDGAKHGYAVIEALRDRSGEEFDLPEGTVYPALHRLEKAGCLSSDWSVVGGRRRRTYSLTDRGRSALTEKRAAWDGFASAVTQVLGDTPWPATT
ncbi:MAG: helix-turn-helix transcriptional regulator [Actinomycetota bacterium]